MYVHPVRTLYVHCTYTHVGTPTYVHPMTSASTAILHTNYFCRHSDGLTTMNWSRDQQRVVVSRSAFAGCTRVKTHKLVQVCKQVVTSLFTSCQQVVFALFVPSLL